GLGIAARDRAAARRGRGHRDGTRGAGLHPWPQRPQLPAPAGAMSGAAKTAVLVGEGVLPGLVARALADPGPAPLVLALEGIPVAVPAESFRLEQLVPLLDRLVDEGFARVVFAGAIRRPRLDP